MPSVPHLSEKGYTLNLLIGWYCDLLDEVGDRAMLKNRAKV